MGLADSSTTEFGSFLASLASDRYSMHIKLITGFPGFLGSQLLPRLLQRARDSRAVCLVQPKYVNLARERLAGISQTHPELAGRVELVEGDITQSGLGMDCNRSMLEQIEEVFHLAAIYDLSVNRDLAMRVNVQGTRNVLDFCEELSRFKRLHYVSTCYVSGRFAGSFSEADLERGQSFNNFYEETKYLAEIDVRARSDSGLPATVYRPSIVVGDSQTGATQKYDGPYSVMRWLLRQPGIAILPVVGRPSKTRVNLISRDFVVDAITWLSGQDSTIGKTYQLADPSPPNVSEMIKLLAKATRRLVIRIPLPLRFAKFAIDRIPGVDWLMQIPSSQIDYFVHPTRYDCRATCETLKQGGLEPPSIASYVDRLVKFVRQHPEVRADAMT